MKTIIYAICFFVSFGTTAQMAKDKLPKNGSVSGKVIDAKTEEPIPYASIVVKDIAGKTVTGGITDELGVFEIKKIPEGKNIVEIQFIGYQTFKKEVNIVPGNLKQNLGTIALIEEAANLEEVTVVAETSTITQKVDRKVINVGKDLTSAGTTASELLNNVPSVSVDSQTGNISLRGNENVRVLVDGKPTNISAAQLLQQIPSTSIKSIELITNPSAKYNPEGMSGIINIVLHKNANQGFNGSVNSGATAGHYVRYNTSTNMNYKTGKVNFFGNYGYNGGDNYNFGFVERDGINFQDFIFVFGRDSHLLKTGADIYINDKNTISVYTTQNWFESIGEGDVLITDELENALMSDATNLQNTDNHTQTYNLNFTHDFAKEGHNIEFEANYSMADAPEDALNTDALLTLNDLGFRTLNFFNAIENERNNTLINVDYTNPLSKNSKLELGLEYRVDNTDNFNLTDQERFTYELDGQGNLMFDEKNDPIISGTERIGNSSFEYDRNIYSAYANYNHKFGKLNMQVGARLEQYEIEGNFTQEGQDDARVTDEIFSVYPSAFLTYNPSEKNQYQLSYSRRVDRPSIQQVNPIREWSTPLVTSIGNSELVPQFTNSVELNYTRKIKGGSITVGTFYRKINDVISRITFQDPADASETRQILTFTNFDDTDAYGLELSSNFKIVKWWNVNASMDFYSQKQLGVVDVSNPNASTVEVTNEVFNARVSNSFKASKNLRFQLFAMYRGPQEDIQWQVGEMWMINAGANLNVLKGKGTITFRVNDIFEGMKFQFDSVNPFVQDGRFQWESRTSYVGFNYRFGGGKNRAKRRRNRDNNEKQSSGFF
ncbi:MAG: TonB-dependent receptor [Flavobacteriaceae bacterium]|nr:TonB-dependent receptor [Flavobacteriaceae bacterium]